MCPGPPPQGPGGDPPPSWQGGEPARSRGVGKRRKRLEEAGGILNPSVLPGGESDEGRGPTQGSAKAATHFISVACRLEGQLEEGLERKLRGSGESAGQTALCSSPVVRGSEKPSVGWGPAGAVQREGELLAELPVRITGKLYVSGRLGRTSGRLSQDLWTQGPCSFF